MIQSESCPHERDVIEAARIGVWSESLTSHLTLCSLCDDIAVVAGFLGTQRSQAGSVPALPDPGLIWWKAQLAARRAAVEKATRPIAWVESAAWAIAGLSCVALAVWQAPAVAGMVRLLRHGLGVFDSVTAGSASGLLLLLVLGAMPFLLFYSVASALNGILPKTARQRSTR